jgi:hypothetical protein
MSLHMLRLGHSFLESARGSVLGACMNVMVVTAIRERSMFAQAYGVFVFGGIVVSSTKSYDTTHFSRKLDNRRIG